jgi:hypothetical protein
MIKTGYVPIFLLALALSAQAQTCRVLDVELQESYSGPCVEGLAEGYGSARGTARYEGGFRAGKKHGKGVKTWPNGDRYEGGFVEDRKEGAGIYTWGRGPWAGERYEGEYAADKRHGKGTYRWPTGDVYSGPWDNDLIAGPGTPMMAARAKYEEEARAAVAKVGQKVCRELPVGIGERDWVSGVVVAVTEDKVGVRLEDAGRQPHIVAGIELRKNEVTWDEPQAWTPCW